MQSYDVIIVNYNGEKILERCLESVYASVPAPANVIVYDNASADRSCELIRRAFPQVRLIEGPVNIGFGPGNNAAMEHATSDALLFMNNDLILGRDCAAELLAALDRYPEAAIVNPMIYSGWDLDRRDRIYTFGSTTNASGFGYGMDPATGDTDQMSCFSGACFMARTALMRANPFEPRYFLYYEEPELSVRFMRQNHRIARSRSAECWHYVNFSTDGRVPAGIAFRQYYSIPNRWFMLGRFWPWRMMPWAMMVNVAHLIYVFSFMIWHRQWRFLPVAWRAPAEWLAGILQRGGRPPNPNWYQKLDRTPLRHYLTLWGEVFARKK